MTDEAIVSNLKHTVSFTRKVNLGNYESADATFFLQFDTPLGVPFETIIDKAQEAFVACKGTVLTELGIGYTLDGEGVIVEAAGANVSPTKAAAPQAAPLAPTPDAVTTLRGAFGGGEATTDNVVRNVQFGDHNPNIDPTTLSKYDQKKWLNAELQRDPSAFYDNRADKKNPKAPDWKHKKSGLGIWAA